MYIILNVVQCLIVVYEFRFLYVGKFWLSPGIFALTRMLGKPMRYVRCCLNLSAYVNPVFSYVPTKSIRLQNAYKIKKMFDPLQLKYFDLGYAFSDSTITFRQILCPRSYQFPLANSLSNKYLSGFLSGVIILFYLHSTWQKY